MPPRRNKTRNSGESRNNDRESSSRGPSNGGTLTAEQIVQLVASTVEQVLAHQEETHLEPGSQPRLMKLRSYKKKYND
ncbi:hypothetical protein F511_44156 [Dorcoceras hygrometricum]|uniref:Uncharacterized protein n=1 Tax=Dorcoceras hygrometricum TaxID=472368 RepID=A0A2Z6ZY93_9LAMI|nr:hypothetical protein F511_44156 [Dorcoceras hygrometricum]